ncbi:MAG: hypothetical protein J5802_07910 [Butyrivibrio sp.]|nr:hypothetical protein [Butyrivibrio sp.]
MRLKLPNKFKFRIISMLLVIGLIAVAFIKPIPVTAVFDPDKAITYKNFAAKVNVENSVLFIGTYIIHKDALTDELYEKAAASGSESGQDRIYYRSELADGKWFETGNIVNGIRGISVEGIPESIDVINSLYVTYYVGSDGVLKDAKTMAAINPFDLPDPYDLSTLTELEPIKTQYTYSASANEVDLSDYLNNKNSRDNGTLRSDVYIYQILSSFFSLDLRDEQTNKLDKQLQNLNSNYISLKSAGKEEEAKLVYDLMSKVDATRRAIVMNKLSEVDENLLNALYELCSGNQYTVSGDFKDSESEDITASNIQNIRIMQDSISYNEEELDLDEDEEDDEEDEDDDDDESDEKEKESPFNADPDLLGAIGTAMSNCSESYNKHLSKALVDSDDLLEHVIYDYEMQVIENASASGLGGPITNLKHATNIRDNIVSDKEGELELLKSILLSEGADRYSAKATAGVNPEYATYTSEGARKSTLEEQKTKEEEARSQFQYLIEAMRQRGDPPNVLEYVNDRIRSAEELLNRIPDDEYKTYSSSSVNAHIVWLKDEAKRIIDSDESLKSKLTELQEKKEELQKKRDQCLDNNDLSGAKAYDAKIAAVDRDIADEGGEVESLAEELVDKAVVKLADDSDADLSSVAQTLSDMGAEDALDELLEKAEESGASSENLASIQDAKDALSKQNDSEDQSRSEGGGSGNGSIDASALLLQMESLFGKSLDEMDDRELAIADATMSRISKNGITPAEQLITVITNKLVDKNNKYTYMQYKLNKSIEYISLSTISDITEYRYFYDDNKMTATMTYGMKVYIFTRGSDKVRKQSAEAEPEAISTKTVFQNNVYIPEADADTFFICQAEYIYKTDYAVCLTGSMQSTVAEYTEELKQFF